MPTPAHSLLLEVGKQSRQGIVLEIANALFMQDKFQVLRCAMPLSRPHTAHALDHSMPSWRLRFSALKAGSYSVTH